MEPPNKGRVGTRSFVLCREVSFIRRLKCTGIIGIGVSIICLLYIERCSLFGVSFIGGSTVIPCITALIHYIAAIIVRFLLIIKIFDCPVEYIIFKKFQLYLVFLSMMSSTV